MRKFSIQKSSKVLRTLVLLPFFAQTLISPIFALEELIPESDTSVIEVDIPIDTSEDILDEGIATGPEEDIVEPEVPVIEEEVQSVWLENGNIAITNGVVVLEEVYTAPQNGAVSLTFTKLPEESGFLTIKEITLTDEEVEATGAISNIAYDITTDMVDGTYEYDLTLPTTSDDVNVVYVENRDDLLDGGTEVNETVIVENGMVEIEGLEHFTVYVVITTPAAPSTNDINRTNGWAHVNQVSKGIGTTDLEFVQPRNFFSCFEYRTDGDTSQVIDEEHFLEFYGVVDISEGLQQYPYFCLSSISTLAKTIPANEYVEVRTMFGAEGDERFNWTRFDVLVPDSNVTFIGSPKYVPANSGATNNTNLSAQMRVPNSATDARFYIDGDTANPISFVTSTTVKTNYTDYRLMTPLTPGAHTITGSYFDGNWIDVDATGIAYAIDSPNVSYAQPSSNSMYFRPGDNPLRVNVDDDFNQFKYLKYTVYTAAGTSIGTYQVNRADCDLRQAGKYVLCDVDSSTSWTPLVEGEYYATVTTWTSANNRRNNVRSINFFIDSVKPLISNFLVEALQSPYTVYSNEVIASVNATDNIGVQSVRFWITSPRSSDGACTGNKEGQPIWAETTVPTIDLDGKYRATLSTTGLNGKYCVNAQAADLAKTHSTIERVQVLIDNIAPEVEITTHTNNELVNGTQTISGNISDLNLSHYWFVVVNSSGTKVAGPNTVPNNGPSVLASFDWDTTNGNSPDGIYTIKLEARDKAGNKDPNDSVDWVDIIVDNTSPKTTFNRFLSKIFNSPILISGQSLDDNNIAGVELFYKLSTDTAWTLIEDINNPNLNNNPFVWSYSWNPIISGTYDIRAEAYDSLGNREASPTITGLIFDTTQPNVGNIRLFVDYAGKYVNGLSGFFGGAKVDDNLSGVDRSSCQYTLNGTDWYIGTYNKWLKSCTFHIGSLTDNLQLSINVEVDDKAGNTGQGSAITRISDSELPDVTIDIPDTYYGPNKPIDTGDIKGTSTDTVSNITKVRASMKRDTDGKYWSRSFFGGGYAWRSKWYNKYNNVSGKETWEYTSQLPSFDNGITYSVKPYAWDQVHMTPGKTQSDSFTWDSQKPQDPDNFTSNHTVDGYSKNNVIEIDFSGADDFGLSGVKGYYYSFSNTPETPAEIPSNWLPYGTTHVTSDPSADGAWYFNIRTEDNVGNITSTAQYGPFNIDTTPADITWDTPLDESIHKSSVVLSAHTNETMNNFRFKWKKDGGSWDSQNINLQDTSYSYTLDPVEDGIYHLRAQGQDLAKNWSRATDITITVDRTRPTGKILTPSDGEYVKGSINISGWVDDSLSGIDRVEVRLRNSPGNTFRTNWELATLDSENNFSLNFDTNTIPEDNYEVVVVAYDKAGNNKWLWRRPVIMVDNTAPVVGITNPLESEYLKGLVDIRGFVTDDNLSHYNISISPGGVGIHDFSQRIEQNTEYTSKFSEKTLYTWDTTNGNFPDGEYQIRLAARDLAGNRELDGDSEDVITVTVDNTKPTSEITSPSDGLVTNETISIEGNTTDNYSVNEVILSYATYTPSTDTCGDYTSLTTLENTNKDLPFDWSSDSNEWTLEDGTYCIKAQGVDLAGNVENTSVIKNLIYDTTKPTVTLLQLITGILNVTAEDLLSGINTIQIQIGNEEWLTYTPNMNLNDLVNNVPGTYTIHVRVTDKAGNLKEESGSFTIPEPAPTATTTGEALGATTGPSTGTGGYYPYAQTTGTGDREESEEESEEEATEENEEKVLGETTCDTTYKVSGTVFYDKNKDRIYDDNEKGVKGIDINIYDINGDLTKTVQTDDLGNWEAYLCPGEYSTEVEGAENQEFVLGESDTTLNIPVEKKFPWLWILIASTAILILLGILADRYKKKEETILG